jgi:hypothetical protein
VGYSFSCSRPDGHYILALLILAWTYIPFLMELGFSKWVLAFALSSWLLFSRAYSGEPVLF